MLPLWRGVSLNRLMHMSQKKIGRLTVILYCSVQIFKAVSLTNLVLCADSFEVLRNLHKTAWNRLFCISWTRQDRIKILFVLCSVLKPLPVTIDSGTLDRYNIFLFGGLPVPTISCSLSSSTETRTIRFLHKRLITDSHIKADLTSDLWMVFLS